MPDDLRQMTSTEMRSEAAELERAAKSYLERAKQLREVAALVDGLARASVDLGLSSGHEYVTVGGMSSTETVTKHPGPVAGKGPASALAKELGFSNLRQLADALEEEYTTVRAWNSRDAGLPDRVAPAVAKLRKSLKK